MTSKGSTSSARPAAAAAGRTAAWLAKQVELGLAQVDLSLPQYRILWLLDAGPTVSSALADRLAVRPPSVTAVVDGLVSRGLVSRQHAEDDRRRVSHVLTPAGRRLLDEADRAVEERLGAIAACLPDPAMADTALADLDLWHQALRAHHEQAVDARRGVDQKARR